MRRQTALRFAGAFGFLLSLGTLAGGMAAYGCGGGTEMQITDLEPKQGPTTGDQPVQIIGQNFRVDVGYTVYFGTKRAENVTILDDQHLLVMSPSRDEPGPVDLQVLADNGPAFRLPQAFRYEESAAPGTGPTKGTKLTF